MQKWGLFYTIIFWVDKSWFKTHKNCQFCEIENFKCDILSNFQTLWDYGIGFFFEVPTSSFLIPHSVILLLEEKVTSKLSWLWWNWLWIWESTRFRVEIQVIFAWKKSVQSKCQGLWRHLKFRILKSFDVRIRSGRWFWWH